MIPVDLACLDFPPATVSRNLAAEADRAVAAAGLRHASVSIMLGQFPQVIVTGSPTWSETEARRVLAAAGADGPARATVASLPALTADVDGVTWTAQYTPGLCGGCGRTR